MLLGVLAAGLADIASARGRQWVRHAGELYAIRVPDRPHEQQLSVEEGAEIVSTYRWIYLNASEKTLSEAKSEATSLADAVGNRPLVLVYMPRHTTDGQRNEYHPNLRASLRALIERALRDGGELLVSAKSYGVHQALHVIREFNDPKILLIGISPAFGAFGGARSANVLRYINDVEETRSKYCMIASEFDVFPWQSGGAAFRRGPAIIGDPRVFRAMDRNRDNVDYALVNSPGHGMDKYLDHGLVGAMRSCVDHFGMRDTVAGDVAYGRAPAGDAARARLAGHPAASGGAREATWIIPLIFLTNQ